MFCVTISFIFIVRYRFTHLFLETEGLVERVVLLGAPVSVKGEQWEPARKVPSIEQKHHDMKLHACHIQAS
jgi:hypothetical protein